MKKYYTMMFCVIPVFTHAQNLVINPSFEIHSACPNQINQVDFATGWKSWAVTPDYFHACSNVASPNFGVPLNNRAFQPARTGDAYMGLFTHTIFTPNQREFIGGQLASPLTPGQQYFVSFWVNHAENPVLLKATDGIGIKFSTVDHNYFAEPDTANDAPHVFSSVIITDTINWVQVHGSFIADSAYAFFGIGNYFGDALTNVIQMGSGSSNYAYYLLDDVCISANPDECNIPLAVSDNNFSSSFRIYPNPAGDFVNVKFGELPVEGSVTIKNIAGQELILLSVKLNPEIQVDIESLQQGIYFVEWSNSSLLVRKKLVVQR